MIEEARNLSLGTSDPRLQATFTNPDLLGAYACLTLPLILAYATESGITWKYRVVRGWLVKAMIAMTILTQSRGAIIACAIGCLFVSAKHMHPRFALLKSQTKLTFAAIISAAILIPLALMPHFLHQGRSVSDAQRFTTWRGAVTIIKSHPIFGLGTGAFPAALASLRLREPIEGSSIPNASEVSVHLHSHDIFLQWWIEQGMLGLILAIALIGIAAKKAIQIFAAKNITPDPIALGASAALVAILCENVPDYTLWFTPIWLIFGYVFGLAASDDKVKVTPELKLLN
jgi:O-antigen ligase